MIKKAEHKKHLQVRAEKDPRDYIGITIDEHELPDHVDGHFVGYANHSTVMLVWDAESNMVKRAHHAYVDEWNVRVLEQERLSPNSVFFVRRSTFSARQRWNYRSKEDAFDQFYIW